MSAYITEEEVWLRAYTAVLFGSTNMTRDRSRISAKQSAEDAVADWKERFSTKSNLTEWKGW